MEGMKEWIADRLQRILEQRVHLLLLAAFIIFRTVVHADDGGGGDRYCAICSCTTLTHVYLAPWGCQIFGFYPFDCYLHPGMWCDSFWGAA